MPRKLPPKRFYPPPGGETFQVFECGPPTYLFPITGKVTRVVPIPVDEWQVFECGPPLTVEQAKAIRDAPPVTLVPTAGEITALPRNAQAAFAARCADRVRPVAAVPTESALDTLNATVAALTAHAYVRTPLARQLRCIRRDFDRLARLATEHAWADDTPVPPDVFGPLWPKRTAPAWASAAGEAAGG